MTLNQLRYYTEIVQQKNFTKAAERLFVSQSTLSKSIRALEDEFKIEFISRICKEFKLTREGEIFYEYAVRILDFYNNQTEEQFRRLKRADGTLKIGIPPTSGAIFFFSVLHRFKKKYPGIDLRIDESASKSIHKMVADGKLDIGAVIEPFHDECLYKRPVCTSEAVLLVSKQHPLAENSIVAFSELKSEKFLSISSEYMFSDIVQNKCREAGFEPKVVFESYQWEWILEMVADNQGVSILPKPLIDKFHTERVCMIRLKEPDFPWTLSLIYRKDKFVTVPMQCFLDTCFEKSS